MILAIKLINLFVYSYEFFTLKRNKNIWSSKFRFRNDQRGKRESSSPILDIYLAESFFLFFPESVSSYVHKLMNVGCSYLCQFTYNSY